MSKKTKIKLVFAPIFDIFRMGMPSLGMATLASYIRGKGYHVDQEDLLVKIRNRKKNQKKLNLDMIRDYPRYINYLMFDKEDSELDHLFEEIYSLSRYDEYDIIGFSVHSIFQLLFSLPLAKKIKENTGAKIIFGGTLITLYGYLFLEKFEYIDYMIVGDGELPFLRLIEHIEEDKHNRKDIPGLVFREDSRIINNPETRLDINEVPIPDFCGLPLKLYEIKIKDEKKLVLPYQIKKGCDNRCSFCTHHTFSPQLQTKKTSKVISELSIMKEKYKTEFIYFCDSTFNTTYSHSVEVCDALLKAKLNLLWGGLGRTNNTDMDLLVKMKKSGCVFLRYGIESGCNKITKNINKRFTVEDASLFLKNSNEAGIINVVSIIAGYPHETHEDVKKTIEFLRKNSKYIQFANVVIFFLENKSLMAKNPERFGISNLRFRISGLFNSISSASDFSRDYMDLRKQFAFDEINGLHWKFKRIQQNRTRNLLRKIIRKYVNPNIIDDTSYATYFNSGIDCSF